jgi:hypothetical protein
LGNLTAGRRTQGVLCEYCTAAPPGRRMRVRRQEAAAIEWLLLVLDTAASAGSAAGAVGNADGNADSGGSAAAGPHSRFSLTLQVSRSGVRRGTREVIQGYSQGTAGVLVGYYRGTHRGLQGYSWGTTGVLTGDC